MRLLNVLTESCDIVMTEVFALSVIAMSRVAIMTAVYLAQNVRSKLHRLEAKKQTTSKAQGKRSKN